MARLGRRRLQKSYCGQRSSIRNQVPKIGQRILVIGLIGMADQRRRTRRQVMRVGGGGPILEGRVVRIIDTIALSNAIHGRYRIEARIEPPSRDILRIQEVADVCWSSQPSLLGCNRQLQD